MLRKFALTQRLDSLIARQFGTGTGEGSAGDSTDRPSLYRPWHLGPCERA